MAPSANCLCRGAECWGRAHFGVGLIERLDGDRVGVSPGDHVEDHLVGATEHELPRSPHSCTANGLPAVSCQGQHVSNELLAHRLQAPAQLPGESCHAVACGNDDLVERICHAGP